MGTHAVRTLSAKIAAKETLNTPPSRLANTIQVKVENEVAVAVKLNMDVSNIALKVTLKKWKCAL